jgi:hypothetical protein
MIQFIQKLFNRTNERSTSSKVDEPYPQTPAGLPEDSASAGLNMHSGFEIKFEDTPSEGKNNQSGARNYRKMTQDPTINGTLQMYDSILRMAKWHEEMAPEDGQPNWSEEKAIEAQQFLKSCKEDMQGSMKDLVSQFSDMLTHGFQVSVPQFKFRHGPEQDDPKRKSKYSDSKIGWQYFKAIDPYSVYRWETPRGEGYSNLTGIHQQTLSGEKTYIPRDRALIFRTTAKNDSPSGFSILNGAVEPWKEKVRSADIELIGLERNLEGIPILDVPASYLTKTATDDQKAVVQYLKKAGSSLKMNNQTYMLRPSDRDDNGNRLIDIELLSTSGTTRPEAARAIVESKERLIAESLLSQFLKLGSSSGSYALSSDLTDIFILALKTYLDHIKDILNSEAIRYLWKVNKMDMRYMPRFEFSGLEKDNVSEFLNALSQVANANLIVPSKEIQKEILERLDLPYEEAGKNWEEVEELRDKLADAAISAENNAQAISGAGSGKDTNTNQSKPTGGVKKKSGTPVDKIITKG